ncbi:MAG: DinB family protein [Ignavibacteriaceae bacterium]
MKRFSIIISILLVCGLMINKISAQEMESSSKGNSASLIAQLAADDLQGSSKKIIALAEAVPAEDYNWRPEEGVRSVAEVYVHIGMSNYFILSFLGEKMPQGFDQNAEKNMTDKKDIINFLKQSFDDAQKFLSDYSDTDYDTIVELPFGKFSKKQILMLTATHAHEHLGQSIAYARTNHIVPPWSK